MATEAATETGEREEEESGGGGGEGAAPSPCAVDEERRETETADGGVEEEEGSPEEEEGGTAPPRQLRDLTCRRAAAAAVWLAMTSSFRVENQDIGNSNYDSSEEGSVVSQEGYTCFLCPHIYFENGSEYWEHIRGHVGFPRVVLHRLSDAYIQALKQRKKRPPRRGHFARKRIRSYLAPKVQAGKKNSLKLKLKLSGSSKSHFEVVPTRVLVGPGDDVCLLNGGVADPVKTENLLDDVEWGKTVDEAGRDAVGSDKTVGEETLDEVALLCEEEEDRSKEGAGNADEKKRREKECEEIDLGDEGFENEDLISIEKSELDIPPTPAATPVPDASPLPSPTPAATSPDAASPEDQEQNSDEDDDGGGDDDDLPDSDFPENGEDFPSPPAMVEINGSAVADVRSPVFPSTSPAPPAGQSSSTPPTRTEDLQEEGNSEGQEVLPDAEQVECDSGRGSDSSFVWNDVGDSGDIGSGGGGDEDTPLEEDPLLLPEGGEAGRSGGAGSGTVGDSRSSPGSAPVEGNAQSILRDFLSEEAGTEVPTSNANLEFSLGSEFISYDRLGENAAFCDVCGERSADQAALDEHRLRAGHFRCPQPTCVGTLFSTPDDLLSHTQSVHGNQQQHHHTPPPAQQQQRPTPPPPQQQQQQQQQQYGMGQSQSPVLEQAAPVQQLVQQVQRLPVPQGPMQALNRAPPHPNALVQQLSSGMVLQQQPQYHPRPPPLHPAPAPIMQQYAQSAPPPYPGPPQVMFPPQAYGPHGQSYMPNARQPMQVQGRPYMIPGSIPQQMRQVPPPRMQGPPMQRGITPPQLQAGVGPAKRVGQQAPPPQSKHRRMDMLIPDARHDDADCHVIAMQKRTDSGPVIGSVQGSSQSASGRAESTINLTESITLSVRGQQQQQQPAGKPRNDANTVATLLATRGITVTPAGGSGRSGNQGPVQNQQQPQQLRQVNRQGSAPVPSQPQQTQPVATLNLNSAISIIPTASVRQGSKQPQQQQQQQSQPQGNFAVPQGRSANRPQTQAQVERPPRPPTVDLTGDNPPLQPSLQTMSGRGRGRGRGSLGRHMCHICDKVFTSPEALNQHIQVHRSPGKLPYRCTLCSAQYPNQQGLMQHRQTFHKEAAPATELVAPIVDLKNPTTVSRLSSLGIRHFLPLSQLANQSGGCFGLPLLTIEGGRHPNASLSALTSNRILSFGPLRQLPQ